MLNTYSSWAAIDGNGKVICVGHCPTKDIPLYYENAEIILEVTNVNCTLGAQFLGFDDNENPIFSTPPTNFHVFNKLTNEWEIDINALAQDIRTIRNRLLLETDWTQLPDVPLSNKNDWAQYRQALRDIPQQEDFPLNVIWPVKPGD